MISARLAKLMYEAFYANAKGVGANGTAMPTWENLDKVWQDNWIRAAEEGRAAIVQSMELQPHELSQLKLARFYINNYADARVSGHNALSIMAKVATALGIR